MFKLNLIAVGDEIAAVLPSALTARLQVSAGDSLFAVESSEGYLLTSQDPEFVHQVNTAATVMKRRRQALSVLCR